MVSFGYLWLRRKWAVDPAAVYRLAMVRLNTHPGLLEVRGAVCTACVALVGTPA